jgi:biotin carboxyl carrier protein
MNAPPIQIKQSPEAEVYAQKEPDQRKKNPPSSRLSSRESWDKHGAMSIATGMVGTILLIFVNIKIPNPRMNHAKGV